MSAEEKNTKKTLLSEDAQNVLDAMLDLLKHDAKAFEVPDFLADNDNFHEILTTLIATQEFCDALRKGEIDHTTKVKGYSISQLKAVQMELRNLIWQMKEISKGQSYAETYSHSNLTSSFHSMMGHLTSKIQKLNQSKKNFQEISSRDPLTNAYNRNALADEFLHAIHAATEKGHCCAVLYLDIDFFKRINDTYGHNVGDIVLKEFVKRIEHCKRDTDLCCRLGGEEFIVLMPSVIEEFIPKIDERFRRQLTEKEIDFPGGSLSFTYSAGITSFTPHKGFSEDDLTDIINFADQLLYEAKRSGRARSIIQNYH